MARGRPTGDLAPARSPRPWCRARRLRSARSCALVPRPGRRLGLDNYANLGTTGGRNACPSPVWEAAGNSLRTAALATVLAVVIGARGARRVPAPALARGRRAISVLDSVFMLPLGVSA
nr:hypothetical protein [Cellulosimicrobium sp. MM]